MAVHIFYNAQKGEGVDNLSHALYKGRRLSLLMLKIVKRVAIFALYNMWMASFSRSRHNNNCRLVSFHCFVEYEVYYSLESAHLS